MSEYWENLTTGKKVRLILVVILAIFIITFAVVNWQESVINFIFFRLKIPITLLIIICATIGYLISSLFEYRHYSAKVKEINALNEEIKRLNEALAKTEETPVQPFPDAEEHKDEII